MIRTQFDSPAVRLVFLPRAGEAPAVWLIQGGAVAARRADFENLPDDLPVVVAVPGEAVLCRWIDVPAGREAQAAAAAALLLEGELAQPREQLHVALGPASEGGRRLVLVVEQAQMAAWLEAAAALPRVDALTPDCLLLSPLEADETVAARIGGRWLVRGPELAATLEPELLPLVTAGRPVTTAEEPRAVEALLARGAAVGAVDLRQGAFSPARSGSAAGWRTPAMLAALLALSVVALPAAEAARFALANRAAADEIKALSGVTDGLEAATRLEARLARLQAAERFADRTAAVLSAVERADGMEVQTLAYDEEGVLRLSVAHANYSDVELLRTTLARSGLAVQETSASSEGDRIVSDLLVRPVQ